MMRDAQWSRRFVFMLVRHRNDLPEREQSIATCAIGVTRIAIFKFTERLGISNFRLSGMIFCIQRTVKSLANIAGSALIATGNTAAVLLLFRRISACTNLIMVRVIPYISVCMLVGKGGINRVRYDGVAACIGMKIQIGGEKIGCIGIAKIGWCLCLEGRINIRNSIAQHRCLCLDYLVKFNHTGFHLGINQLE